MNVKEISDLLLSYHPDLRVMVEGYEGGYADVNKDSFEITHMKLDVNNVWYYGPHEKTKDEKGFHIGEPMIGSVPTLLIRR